MFTVEPDVLDNPRDKKPNTKSQVIVTPESLV